MQLFDKGHHPYISTGFGEKHFNLLIRSISISSYIVVYMYILHGEEQLHFQCEALTKFRLLDHKLKLHIESGQCRSCMCRMYWCVLLHATTLVRLTLTLS